MVKYHIGIVLSILVLTAMALPIASADDPYVISTTDANQEVKVPLYTHVTRKNVGEIFRHFKHKRYVAKAVAVSLFNQEPTIYFFPLGDEEGLWWNIRHFNVLKSAANEQRLLSLNGPNITDQQRISEKLFESAQGFQMQADPLIDGQLRITGFDIDSSITGGQVKEKLPLSQALQNSLLEATIKAIDPILIDFVKPSWPESMNWQCENFLGQLRHIEQRSSSPSL